MSAEPEYLQWLVLLIWLAVLFVFSAGVAAAFFSSRTLRVGLSVSWFGHHSPHRPTLRPLLLAVAVAIAVALLLTFSAGETLSMRLALALVGAGVSSISFDWGWKQAAAWVLRRSAQNRDWDLLADSACADLQQQFDPAAITPRACALLAGHLGCAHVYFYSCSGDSCTLSEHVPRAPEHPVVFPASSLLCRQLSSTQTFHSLPVLNPANGRPLRWSQGDPGFLAAEQNQLALLDACAVVPMQRELVLAGFFILGPRPSGEPFRPHHLRFAEAVSRQTAISLATAGFAASAFEQALETAHEQASRRTARAARTHLAPPERAKLPGLDFGAEYWLGDIPGGAFYDVLSLPNRATAVFIAEIPGPPEEAAVRLVQLQALLRGHALTGEENLAEMLDSTRRALALSAANREPVALFCARYTASSGKLHYVNAGHYPPLLLRRGPEGAQITRLTTGGPPLGAPDAPPLEEASIDLLAGDILAISSAGIPAALAPDLAPWGEGALVDALLRSDSQTARELVSSTLASALEFTDRDPSQPPRLLIVLRAIPRGS
ncbi:MAG: serine/threonine-protein phosphatase [Candidatus Solibacter usitatus]|nr:serine/threonine-protein phosphatase [Candidatus Solibacter usitatus]